MNETGVGRNGTRVRRNGTWGGEEWDRSEEQ